MGTLPAFVHALEAIDHSHQQRAKGERPLPRNVIYSMKARAAKFNHALKAMIENDKTLSTQNITEQVGMLYGVLNRDRHGDDRSSYEQAAKRFQTQLEGTLRGMKQEVVAEQILTTLARTHPELGIEVNPHVSTEDDLHGVDVYVTLEGVTFPLDIKASERTAANARKKSRSPASIITTGVNTYEIGDGFAIPEFRARKAGKDMLEKLYAARDEYLRQHPQQAEIAA